VLLLENALAHLRSEFRLFALAAALLAVGVSVRAQTLADPSVASLGGAAKLLSFTGQISVMRDSTAWALNAGDIVQPEQVVITGADGYGMFQVADGSKFEVFPKSRVVFRANRGDWKDLLEVWLGKVRVQIEHAGGVPNHNKVRTPTAVISVRGTVFDVEVEDENATTLVLDEEGQVEVRHLLKVSEPKILNPGDWVRVYKNEPLAQKGVDKGSLLQRAARAASDAFYQAALNASHAGSVARTPGTTSPGLPADKNNGNPAPPPPPPAPPAAPPPAPAP
jgi:ferric-dicitrate binding protein FerR (iron transport regulator)